MDETGEGIAYVRGLLATMTLDGPPREVLVNRMLIIEAYTLDLTSAMDDRCFPLFQEVEFARLCLNNAGEPPDPAFVAVSAYQHYIDPSKTLQEIVIEAMAP